MRIFSVFFHLLLLLWSGFCSATPSLETLTGVEEHEAGTTELYSSGMRVYSGLLERCALNERFDVEVEGRVRMDQNLTVKSAESFYISVVSFSRNLDYPEFQKIPCRIFDGTELIHLSENTLLISDIVGPHGRVTLHTMTMKLSRKEALAVFSAKSLRFDFGGSAGLSLVSEEFTSKNLDRFKSVFLEIRNVLLAK